MQTRRGKRSYSHPNAEELLALVEEEASSSIETRAHVAGCAVCYAYVAQLRATREILRDVATQRIEVQSEIARSAVARLRLRHSAIGKMNEVFYALCTLFRGLAGLLGVPPDAINCSPRRDEGSTHG